MALIKEYVADTNTVIRLLQGELKVIELLQDKSLTISCVTEMELLAWPQISSAEIDRVKVMLREFTIIELQHTIKKEAVLIRRKTKMKLLDAIIAATALQMEMPLITGDVDFKRAEKLIDVVLI